MIEKDTRVFKLINEELKRQRHGLELIASENFVSKQVMQASKHKQHNAIV